MSCKIMRARDELHKQQCSCLIIKNNSIIYKSHEKGICPLLRSVNLMSGAILADKIIGKAAALLCALGQAEGAYGQVMSKPAQQILKQYKIKYEFGIEADNISNRPKTDVCPMERLVEKIDSPEEAFHILMQTMQKAGKQITGGDIV